MSNRSIVVNWLTDRNPSLSLENNVIYEVIFKCAELEFMVWNKLLYNVLRLTIIYINRQEQI